MAISRRSLIATGIALVVALVITAFVTWNIARDSRSAVDVVQEYVDAIAAGEASTANSLVDPSSFEGLSSDGTDEVAVDPALLTDEVLEARVAPLIIDSVGLAFGVDDDIAVGDVADVEVEYRVEDSAHTATLRVERRDDDGLGMRQWRILDPLLVPVIVEVNEVGTGPALLGPAETHSASIPVSGPAGSGAAQHASLLYPGTYFLGGAANEYLTAGGLRLNVGHDTVESVTGSSIDAAQTTALTYSPTPELLADLEEGLDAYLERCTGAGPFDDDCPESIRLREDLASDFTVTYTPGLSTIGSHQVEWVDGLPSEPTLRAAWSSGQVEYTTSDGDVDYDPLRVFAWISIADGSGSIEFRTQL